MWRGRIALGAGASLLLALASLSPVQADDPRDGVMLRRAAAQVIANNTQPLISWDTEDLDEGGYWTAGDPTVVTAPRDGWCTAYAWTEWPASGTAGGRFMSIAGTALPNVSATSPSVSGWQEPRLSASVSGLVTAGETFGVSVFQNSGSNKNVVASLTVTCDLAVGGGSAGSGPCQTPEPTGGECVVEVTAFTDSAAETLNLGIFAVVVVGGFLVMMLAWIAVQGMRR